MIGQLWPAAPANADRWTPQLPRQEQAAVIASTVLILAALLSFGADRNDFALFFSGLLAFLLALLLLTQEWAKSALAKRFNSLAVPGALFALACLAIAWAATPFGPNGSHPIWSYVDAAPAIAIDRSVIFVGLLKLFGLACTFMLGWLIASSDNRARYFFKVVVAAMSGYGFWALLAHAIPALKFGVYGAFQGDRLSGSLQSANTAGTLFAASFILALCLVFEASRHASAERGSWLAKVTVPIIATALLGTCLILTVSRGASTAALISCVILLIWEMFSRDWHGIKKHNLYYGLGIAAGVVILAWSGDLLLDRYAASFKDWIDQRQSIYGVHWDAFLASPWFGYGIGSFDEVNKLLQTALNFPVLWNIRAAHNVYLQWLEQAGIAGTIPMFLCIGFVIGRTAWGVRVRRRMTTWIRGCVAVALVFLIHGWSDFSLEVPAIALFWSLILGAGYSISISQSHGSHSIVALDEGPAQPSVRKMAKLAAASAFTVFVSALCLFSCWEIVSPFGLTLRLLPLSAVYGYQAQQIMNNSDGGGSDISRIKELTTREVDLSPARADGWLRLAMIASVERQPNTTISSLLEKSYLVAPLDPQIFVPRTRFVLEHWNNVSAGVREEALEAVRAGWLNWIQQHEIQMLPRRIANPAGRLAIALEIAKLSSLSGLAGR
jgi:O-antigen ligase